MSTVGNRIKHLRKEKKITQKQLGDIIGTSQQMIGQYEKGDRYPNLLTIKKISDALSIRPSELLYDEKTATSLISDLDFDPNEIKKMIDIRVYRQLEKPTAIHARSESSMVITIDAVRMTNYSTKTNNRELTKIFNQLNIKGKQKLYEYAQDLLQIEDYKRKD